MSKRTPKGAKIGRPVKHGAYSLDFKRDLLLRENPVIRHYLENTRAGLIHDVGGSEAGLSEQQRIMIDRIISRLAIVRLIELHVSKNGAFAKQGDKVLPELVPALGQNYLSFTAAIDRALVALGLEKRAGEKTLDLAEYIKRFDEDKAAREAKARDAGKAEIVVPAQSLSDESGQEAGETREPGNQARAKEPESGEIARPEPCQGQESGQGEVIADVDDPEAAQAELDRALSLGLDSDIRLAEAKIKVLDVTKIEPAIKDEDLPYSYALNGKKPGEGKT